VADAQGTIKIGNAIHRVIGMEKDLRYPRDHNENKDESVVTLQTASDCLELGDFETGKNQIFADELFPFALEHIAIFHHHRHEKVRFEHPNPRAESIVKAITPRLDPKHSPNDGEVEKEDDVRDPGVGEGDRDNGGAAGNGPVRGDIEPLPPDHDPADLAAIKMRHRIDVTRVVQAPLQRDGRFIGRRARNVFSCHGCSINWITAFVEIIQQILSPMAIALSDLLKAENIDLGLKAATQTEALHEITGLLATNHGISDSEIFLTEVTARERTSSTLTEDGVAFPHARTELVDQIVVGIGRSEAGIPWNESGDLAHLIFLIGVPQKMLNDYLIVIGAIARVTKDDPLRTLLLHAENVAEFIETMLAAPSL
jgi:PTS system nitrogen regulatory IIA component